MAYSSRTGKRPDELASKSSHSFLINDEDVKSFLENCEYPKSAEEVVLDKSLIIKVEYPDKNSIEHIIAMDGGYSTISVKKTFPSSLITFFQFGEIFLNTEDLDSISEMPFISRESMSALKDLERSKLVLPTKNVSYNSNITLTHSVRRTIYDYFKKKGEGKDNLLSTTYWLIFNMFDQIEDSFNLTICPHCEEKNQDILRKSFDDEYITKCPECDGTLYITDCFRLHEVIDDELGAGGILGYLVNLIEQVNIIHTIKYIKETKPKLLDKFFFIKDGPLAFFGQTANMHKHVRKLCNYLFKHHNLFLAGLEKSGAFVEHADEIKDLLNPGEVLLLNNKHIYSYILPGDPGNTQPYAGTSYYSSKIIFKSRDERIYVVTLPVENENIVLNPQKDDFKNLDIILWNIEKLRCDMYDNSIVPVALANKLISLSSHPSSTILEKFAKTHTK
ncbi:DNA double-strand break repair nuclease NurA [Elizabethkingia anophelis]|nr:DNA double-strand break repair nuclease NurA [Elizabethkingia anophelis]MCT4261420.1 DNA double-strand break repair nuclease NurA [Elizabethkingia anophelis]